MNYGVQKCIWTALGDVTANIIQATLVIFVLGSFFVDNPSCGGVTFFFHNSSIFIIFEKID